MITEEVTEWGTPRPFKVLGKTFLIQEGTLEGTVGEEVTFNNDGTPTIINVVLTTPWSLI